MLAVSTGLVPVYMRAQKTRMLKFAPLKRETMELKRPMLIKGAIALSISNLFISLIG